MSEEEDRALIALLRQKPRRTASGVATITVLTKPWPCSSNCIYCPNDIRMPKSYLADEPACQRAERSVFDPYLQVLARLGVLADMGHPVDKVELIVLGGTWSDYPEAYRTWFITGLFCALNDFGSAWADQARDARRAVYGIDETAPDGRREAQVRLCAEIQKRIDAGELTYNEGIACARSSLPEALTYTDVLPQEVQFFESLTEAQVRNESAASRCVGLVIETQPEDITPATLTELRRLGCTKIQIGIQSLDDEVLALNGRVATSADVRRAMGLMRLYGFKSHVHFMANLMGSNPEKDEITYGTLISDPAYMPDEIKLYPCALVGSARLMEYYREGAWTPYTHEELLRVLGNCLLKTPPFVRISRMIRDISSTDIVAGNKKTNLRQMVEQSVSQSSDEIQEMRLREIALDEIDLASLALEEIAYRTENTEEIFLQWVTPKRGLAAFLRLSLPDERAVVEEVQGSAGLPIKPGQAMIREVHVYGKVSRIHKTDQGAQHAGLGKRLIERACALAREKGYDAINVISAVGTRNYYRALGFADADLYLVKPLYTN